MEVINLAAIHAKRVTIQGKDAVMVQRFRTIMLEYLPSKTVASLSFE